MTSLPDQFSAARQTQLDNSLNLMRSFSDQALDRTSRVLSLQLDASRAAVEQSSNAMRQLLAARDPRDLLALGSQSQQQLRTMLDFSRELLSIATAGMSVPVLRSDSAGTQPSGLPAARVTAVPQEAANDRAGQAASAAASAPESAAAPVATPAAASVSARVIAADAFLNTPQADTQTGVHAASGADFALPTETASDESTASVVTSVVTSAIGPDAAQTAIAKATSEALDSPGSLPHPVAASMPVEVAVEIELSKIEPVDATPPPAPVTTRPVETRGTKGRRKQN